MAVEFEKYRNNVFTLTAARPGSRYWTAGQHFGAIDSKPSDNDNFGPVHHEGAQTSDHLLEFLYGMAR
ncbi:MAG: hypothetical protein E8G75_07190 [Sulfitobacter sp. SK025]|nr:MAG: hypothetical protein E8G75_07190 [Sulfitobacter sp. SK025]